MKLRLVMLILLSAGTAAAQTPRPVPTANDVARRVVDMSGGPAWDAARYFAFTFKLNRTEGGQSVSFPQRWDRTTGEYRVSGLNPQGKKFEVIMNVQTKKGRAWVDGAEVTGEKLNEMLTAGYRRYQNDTFWLLMPQKLLDPGVNRVYESSRDDACGHSYDVLRLTFEPGLGFGPADIYWAWVDRDSGLVAYWDMQLTGQRDDKPVTVTFREWRRVGGLIISTQRDIPSKKQIVHLDDLQVLSAPPAGAFEK